MVMKDVYRGQKVITLDKLRSLYESGLTLKQIGQKYNRSISAMRHHMKKYGLTSRPRGESTVIHPDMTDKKKLCYILGVIEGDGWVPNYSKYNGYEVYRVGLSVTSKEFVVCFFNALSSIGLHPFIDYTDRKGCSRLWRCSAKSREFVMWYRGLSFSYIKSLLLKKDNAIAFVKGFYESEGSIYNNNGWKHITMVNTNPRTISLCKIALKTMGFKFSVHRYDNNKYYKGKSRVKPIYSIYIGTTEQAERFILMIKPVIKDIKAPKMYTNKKKESVKAYHREWCRRH